MAKKITAIVSLVIVGILIIATLIMANVSVQHGVNCAEPSRIWVVKSSVTSGEAGRYLYKEDKEYEEILNYVNSASKERLLTSLFGGTVGDKAQIKEVTTSNNQSITSPSSKGYAYFVCYEYDTPQTLMNGNKKFKDENGNNYYYGGLFFGVKNEEGATVVDVYVNSWDNYKTTPVYNYHYYYELSADFQDLYTYLNANFK